MSGRREDDQGVTLGEVYRLVKDLKQEHGDKLDAIDTQVRITNGRTTKLETQVESLLKPPTPPGLPVMTPEGESLSIKISPRMWTAIAAIATGLAVFLPMLQRWFEKLLGQQ